MWVEIVPRRPDFCGHPPCPLCYRWAEDNGVMIGGLAKLAVDLLMKCLDQCTDAEVVELRDLGEKIHVSGLPTTPEDEPPKDDGCEVDIGMSSAKHLNGWLKQCRAPPEPPPRHLTVDEIYARQAERDAANREKEQAVQQRQEQTRVFTEGVKSLDKLDPLNGIPGDFIRMCQMNGMLNPRDIASEWKSAWNNQMVPSQSVEVVVGMDGQFMYRR